MIFQKVRGRNNFYLRHDKHKHKLPLSEVIEEHPEEEKGIQSPKKKAKSDEGLILFHMLANIIPYTRYPSTRIWAMEMVERISDHLDLGKVS